MATDTASPSTNPLKRQHEEIEVISKSVEDDSSTTLPPTMGKSSPKRPSTPTDADCINSSKDLNNSRSRSSSILSDLAELTPPPPTPPRPIQVQVRVPNLPPGQQNAFSALNGVPEPPKKKVKLTFAEQEEKRIMKEIAAAEKAQEKEQRDKEKKEKDAEREAERKKRDAEKEAERAAKEAEKKKKETEKEKKRLVKEAEHKKKEEERKKKEEEKREAEEAKRKKERSQPKLNVFFGKPVVKREKSVEPTVAAAETAETKQQTKDKDAEEYDKRWPPFFVQSGVTMAQLPCQRDENARKRLEKEIDACLSGQKHIELPKQFSATKAFNMPIICFGKRGTKKITPVKDIMAELLGTGASSRPIDLTTVAQNRKLKQCREALRQVRYKILKFAEDVRPPYTGTYTKEPSIPLARLARNPLLHVPELDYDYDSEAEWEEPGEDEEDLDSEDEEEEDIEGEDFDGFLDDEDDELTKARRLQMVGGDSLEPISTGLCFEDEKGRVSNIEVSHFRMDILNEHIKSNQPIDPFSAAYWPSSIQPTSMNPPRLPLNTLKNPTSPPNAAAGPQTAKITDMFNLKPSSASKPTSTLPASSASAPVAVTRPVGRPPKNPAVGEKKLIPDEYMEAFKHAVEGSELSKVGLIEVLSSSFKGKGVKKGEIKNTLEQFAERKGLPGREKKWLWKE